MLLRERMKPDAQPEREDLYNLLTEAGLSGDWRTRGLNLLRTVALGEGSPGRLADWLQGRKRDEVAALLERAASVAAGEATPGEQLRAAA